MLAACATSSTPGIWMPTRIARGTGGLVSMVHRSPADGGCLSGLADRIHFAPPRRNRAAAVMNGSGLDHKAALFQRLAKGFVGRGLLGVNPDDQHTGRTQESHQPVECDLKALERAPPPIDQRYVVWACRMAAVRRCCRANIAPTLQLQHELDALGASNDDSVLLRATCKRDHRFNDAIACRSGMRGSHVSPFLVSLALTRLPAGWP